MKTQCAIVWDLDGVIGDSGELHDRSFQTILKDYGVEFSYNTFLKSFGQNNDSVLEITLGKKPNPEMKNDVNIRKEEWFCQHIPGNLKMLPGALDWLKWFKENKIPQAIASSAPMENITLSLDEFHLGNYFEAIVSGNQIVGNLIQKFFFERQPALRLFLKDVS